MRMHNRVRFRFGSKCVEYRCFWVQRRVSRGHLCPKRGSSICCSSDAEKHILNDARVVYSVAPAMGHNQVVLHDICSVRSRLLCMIE